MKASDIMIKDWLRIQYKDMVGTLIEKTFQVGHIEDYNSFFPDEKGDYYIFAKGKEHGNMGCIEYMMGIPLTAEILEKNGFKPHKIGNICPYYKYKDGNDIFTVGLFTRTTELEYVNMIYNPEDVSEVNYGQTLEFPRIINVHELQHALRLCGLSELAEAMEADRKGRYCNVPKDKEWTAFDPRTFHCDNIHFKETFEANIKDRFEDEIADTIIRCLDLCARRGIDIDFHVRAKLEYNKTRGYHHGGKAY